MSRIMKHIESNYTINDWFDARKIGQELNINSKVCAMVLQRMYNNGRLGGHIRPSTQETYYWIKDNAIENHDD